ncbi:LOW QUALITY PROTEIN: uncharacterized protein ACR2FA_010052 [Aphomia sociella]
MKTSYSQFATMVDFMERNGDLSKPTGGPRGRQWCIKKWKELAAILNSDGTGDSKSEEKWRKVWADWKNNTKKKSAKLNRSMRGTGGGPALKILTDLLQRVMALIGIEAATGMGSIPEIGLPQEDVEARPRQTSTESPKDVVSIDICEVEEPIAIPEIEESVDVPQVLPEQVIDTEAIWNTAGTSQETTRVAPTSKWVAPPPPKKKMVSKTDRAMEYLLESERRFYELERERIRQRDIELNLQTQWLEFMKEALSALTKFMEGEKKG